MFEKQKTVQQSIGLKLKKTKLQQQQKANEIVTSFFFFAERKLTNTTVPLCCVCGKMVWIFKCEKC